MKRAYRMVVDTIKGTDELRNKMEQPVDFRDRIAALAARSDTLEPAHQDQNQDNDQDQAETA